MEEITNPFQSLRLRCNMTLGELAAYSRIDIRALNRSEYGMYTNPLPGLVDYWVGRGLISEGVLVSEYEDYQHEVRKFNKHLLGPELTFDKVKFVHPLRQMRQANYFELTAFCKALCLPLDTVQYFEKKWRVQKSVPKQLIVALNQAGYRRNQLETFKDEYGLWRQSNSKFTFS